MTAAPEAYFCHRPHVPTMSHPLWTVDVFAEQPYAGNQLAVVTGASDLDDAEMQAFAAEIDFSETTYVETDANAGPQADGTWPVRIFTPEAEIPFAGARQERVGAVAEPQATCCRPGSGPWLRVHCLL